MTKKILSLIAFVASLAACTDDYKDWTSPQVVPQPEQVSFGDGSVTAMGVIDFNSVSDERVKVCDITAPTSSNAAYTPSYTISLDGTSFALATDGTMTAADLEEYVIAEYGRRPVERDIDATVSMWLSNGTTTVKTATSGTFQVKAIPEAPQISQNYYLVGGTQDWGESAKGKTQKFQHSGADVYEDPVFTIIITAAEGDTWFAIGDDEACEAIANDNDWSKLLGTTKGNGCTDLSGSLDRRYNLKDDGSFCVPAGNKLIKVTLNMMDYTYEIEPLNISENYYLVGATNDWKESAVNKMVKFSHSDKSVFEDPVFTVVFEAAEGDTWFAFGDDEACEAIASDTWNKLFGTKGESSDTEGSFDFRYNLDGDHSFCVPAGSGKYIRFEVNMMDFTYKITPLNFSEFIYEIGNETGWSNVHALRGANYDGKYQGYYWLDGEFKFKPNADNWEGDWEYDGEGKIADNGGSNMPGVEAGFYQINVDLSAMTYSVSKIEAIGIIGGFNGWGGDVDMTYNQEAGCWEATTTIDADTELKFRANHDWAINWGGTADNLTQDGANLNVSAGTYKFQLFISYQGNNRVVITKQ